MNPTRTSATLAFCSAAALVGLGIPAVSHAVVPPAKVAKSCSRAMAGKLKSRLVGASYQALPTNPYDSFLSIYPQNELALVARSAAHHRVIATGVCYYNNAGVVKNITLKWGTRVVQGPFLP